MSDLDKRIEMSDLDKRLNEILGELSGKILADNSTYVMPTESFSKASSQIRQLIKEARIEELEFIKSTYPQKRQSPTSRSTLFLIDLVNHIKKLK